MSYQFSTSLSSYYHEGIMLNLIKLQASHSFLMKVILVMNIRLSSFNSTSQSRVMIWTPWLHTFQVLSRSYTQFICLLNWVLYPQLKLTQLSYDILEISSQEGKEICYNKYENVKYKTYLVMMALLVRLLQDQQPFIWFISTLYRNPSIHSF